MESYKLVNSSDCRRKAGLLGYKFNNQKGDKDLKGFFLVLEPNGDMSTMSNRELYSHSFSTPEITQADFLALPEPLKVGDWVRNGGLKRFGISQIFSIQDNKINTIKNNVDCSERYLDIKDCTKLTPEQIKVLGLDE